ncbi:MAG TPA: cytochrome c [Clostridia bacterium]|nr:cytochrome c [Clostridia bacterium]
MRGFIFGTIVMLLVIFGGGLLLLRLGYIPVGADNPPGRYEKALATWAMDTYVDRHAPRQENPTPITNENLIDGAKEFEEHCAFCHGGAKSKVSPLAGKFNPPVPQIINRVPHDPDANLFWITKHGIRLTGMPSWDGHLTDEEIWKIIAFVKHSDKLPPEVQTAWQQAAQESASGEAHVGEHDDHGPERH